MSAQWCWKCLFLYGKMKTLLNLKLVEINELIPSKGAAYVLENILYLALVISYLT